MRKENILRQILVRLWRIYKSIYYHKKHVYISQGVLFNRNTKFGEYVKVGCNTTINDSSIGSFSYINRDSNLSNCEIGKFCSIASHVSVISSTHPTKIFVSTSPVFHSLQKQCGITFVDKQSFSENLSVDGRSAIIGNDVWIGEGVKIVGGVKIGDGAVIAAGAVVVKDVPPFAIIGGVPAKVIRYRFTDEQITFLKKDAWWNKSESWLKTNAPLFSDIEKYILSNE